VAVLTNAGGLGILCADACEAAGLSLPELGETTRSALGELLSPEASVANPVDMLGGATAQTYAAALPLLLGDAQVDAVIVLFVPTVTATADEVAAAIDAATAERGGEKPVLAVVLTAGGIPPRLRRDDAHVAAFNYPESAARALGHLAQRAEWLRQPYGAVPSLDGIDRGAAENVVERALAGGDDAWLSPADTRELLLAYGVPLVPEHSAGDPDEAVRAAEQLGYPAVVKTAEPGAHKTELGGIALGLADAEAVRAAAERIGGPVIVQPMIAGGAELLAGVVQDPVFGPLVAFGPGGVFAELIGEAAFRIAPLTDRDAEELVEGGKAGRLVRGFRGGPAADAAALSDLLLRLARLGEEIPAVAELDLNPVLALPDRCVAVDARVRVRRPELATRAKTW
jgi:acyl-CoA synthetase (NDP forming)